MKRNTFLVLMLLAFAPAAVFADICSDLTASYQLKITQLTADKDGALAGTSDPFLREAILSSYQMQLDQITMEMKATLASYPECNGGGVVVDPNDPPTDPNDPPTDPNDPPTDPNDPNDPNDPVTCEEKIDAFKADVEAKKGTMSKSELVHYMNSRKVEIKDCLKKCDSNWGRGFRRGVNPL
jgi:hypothetical protein